MKIITCYSENMAEVAALTVPTHEAYAKSVGAEHEARVVPQEDALWSKVAMVGESLVQGFESVFWIDVDAAVTSCGHGLPPLDRAEVCVYATADVHGLNMGVALFRNCLRTRQLVYAVLGHGKNMFRHFPTPEQMAFSYFLRQGPYLGALSLVPQRAMNSYWPGAYDYPGAEAAHWQKGDFILHLPGLPNDRRVEILKEALSV